MTVCLDTNVFLQIFGQRQPFYPLFQKLMDGHFDLAVSTEILLEYEEVTTKLSGIERWRKVVRLLELLASLRNNVRYVDPSYHFGIIKDDPDDNKFCDCAIAVNADFVVTEDAHFEVLKSAGYKPQPVTPQEFIEFLQKIDRNLSHN